jgi:tripartite-type tricarboxylate transporter receptor subunit TctC
MMANELRQPVIVENRPGASGILAMNRIAKARPDGYTIGLASLSQMVFNVYLISKLTYDPSRDLTPVIRLVAGPLAIVANPNFAANSMTELVALAKERPGKIDYAVPQLGAPPHIFALMFGKAAGIELVAVPFRSGPDAVAAVVGGEVPVLIDAPLVVAQQVNTGKLKALAVIGAERSQLLPHTPTLAECGLPDLHAEAWLGLVAPAGVPPAIVTRLNDAASRALSTPALRQQFEELGWRILGGSADAFASAMRDDHAVWGPVIRNSGLRIQ